MGSVQSGKISNEATMEGKNSPYTIDSTGTALHHYYECRKAHHAGSWYSDDREQLHQTLERFLRQVENSQQQDQQHDNSSSPSSKLSPSTALRAIICPHAGYSYSGPTAAYSYHALLQELIRPQSDQSHGGNNNNKITQMVVLHPSHHVPLRGTCAISGANIIATPFGNLHVDDGLREELQQLSYTSDNKKKYRFSIMTQEQDEKEHSGEMQFPFIAHVLQRAVTQLQASNHNVWNQITVTPIMCGSLTVADEIAYGTLLSEILDRPQILTIVSSDFCHWGRRFGYQPTSIKESNSKVLSSSTANVSIPIYQIIQQLDRRGMDLIEAQEPGAFASYLRDTNNTICGQHAIAVWLRAVVTTAQTNHRDPKPSNDTISPNQSFSSKITPTKPSSNRYTVQFVHYEQSSQSKTMSDSSVSYAAAIATTRIPTQLL